MFVGHKKQLKFLEDAARSGKVAQVYLFSGPEKVGKFTLAQMFVKSQIDLKSKNLEEYYSDTKTRIDLEILAPEIVEKKGIKKIKDIEVEKVREAQKRLALFPSEGKKRALIINDAHRLTISSQNALLKNLEEPNNSSMIILVTHNENKILKTIKSRCQKINFNLVALEEIRNGFAGKISQPILEKAVFFSMGKPGEAAQYMNEQELLDTREKYLKDLNLLSAMSVAEKFDLAQEYSKDVNKIKEVLEFWIWIMRAQAYKNIRNENSLIKSYRIIEKMEAVLEKIKNGRFNNRLILENLFLSL